MSSVEQLAATVREVLNGCEFDQQRGLVHPEEALMALAEIVARATQAEADYHRYRLDVGPGDYHERARRLPSVLPVRGAWRDAGVSLIAIEEPFSAVFKGAVPLAVIRGALLAALPRQDQVPLVLLPPYEWKKWSLGGGFPGFGNSKKDAVATWAKSKWSNRPATGIDQNALDAYAIAWSARALDDRRRELAA